MFGLWLFPLENITLQKKYGGQLLLHQVQQYKGDPHCSAINSLLLCITPVDVTHERSEITPIKWNLSNSFCFEHRRFSDIEGTHPYM